MSADEIATVNIWPLNALGTFKRQVADRMKLSLTALPGMSLVFLPLLPSDTHATSMQAEAGGDELASGSGEDHDFDVDQGCLPNVLTQAHAKLPPKILARSMAKDQHDIEQILAYESVPPTHCVHDLFLVPEAMPSGMAASGAVRALALYPLSEDDTTGLERSRTMKDGWFTGASKYTQYVDVSQNVASLEQIYMRCA